MTKSMVKVEPKIEFFNRSLPVDKAGNILKKANGQFFRYANVTIAKLQVENKVFRGKAVQNMIDKDDSDIGKKVALGRAIQEYTANKAVRKSIWRSFFGSNPGYTERHNVVI